MDWDRDERDKSKMSERELLGLYRDRIRDRKQAQTRRRKAVEAGPQKLSGLLKGFFAKDDDAMRRIEESKAIMAWNTCVGEVASRYSRAIRLRGDTLIVIVTDPLWMQQLGLLKQELLRKYRSSFPALQIRDIYFTRGS
jgi:hypothetical protein